MIDSGDLLAVSALLVRSAPADLSELRDLEDLAENLARLAKTPTRQRLLARYRQLLADLIR